MQEIEDNLNRVQTRSKYTTGGNLWGTPPTIKGEGLGPDSIWADGYPNYPAGNGSSIHSTMTEASMLQGSAVCSTEVPLYEHSYAEANVRVITFGNPEGGYNFDVHARVVMSGTTAQGYFAKIVYKLRGADPAPELRVGRFSNSLITEFPVIESICASGCGCTGTVPLGTGGSAWLRVETQDQRDPDGVIATARIGRDCDCSTPPCDISQCGGYCQTSWADDSAFGVALFQHVGAVGMDAHEGQYGIDIFRAGSEYSVP